MEKILASLICAAFMLSAIPAVSAQSTREERKARREYIKDSRKMLDTKVSKIARKEAKKREKDGWMVTSGTLPLEQQLDRSYIIDNEIDEDGFPMYITSTRVSVGSTYDAAKSTAMELAKQDIANLMHSEVAGLIKSSVGNSELTEDEAESLVSVSSESKSFYQAKLGRVVPIVETYRILPNKKREVEVRLVYSKNKAMEIAKQAIKSTLQERSDELSKQLDAKLGW